MTDFEKNKVGHPSALITCHTITTSSEMAAVTKIHAAEATNKKKK
jgi:hypothetical protein